MQRSIAANALPVVVHGRVAAAGRGPEDAIADFIAAADLGGSVIGCDVAARVVSAVNDPVSATAGVDAVDPPQSRILAAPVRPVVVHLRSTAGRVTSVRTGSHRAPAAQRSRVVVDGGVTATSVPAV